MSKFVLFISNIWPEPTTTAAGRRTLALVDFYLKQDFKVHFFAACKLRNKHSEHLDTLGVSTTLVEINNSNFDQLVAELAPNQVVFDRFMIEEQFGWRVKDASPQSIRILDTQDIHYLRIKRSEDLKEKNKRKDHEVKLREVASIYRSDLSLVISKVEYNLLIGMGIPSTLIYYLPFTVEVPNAKEWKSFDDREDFVTVGSFLHEPNTDSVLYFKKEIWPIIRKELPKAKMHVYGAYCQEKHKQWTNEKDGFFVHGFAENALDVISSAKILVAPLRFGAGLKGKLLEAMLTGTPSVTTSIGAEGMVDNSSEWPGGICNNTKDFAATCIRLYQNESEWSDSSRKSINVVENQFSKEKINNEFKSGLSKLETEINELRSENLIGEMLNYHTMRSTKFMSQWIEAKNKLTN